MEEEQQEQPRRNTGLFHDDDGNLDDKRVAAWLTFLGLVYLGYQGVANNNAQAVQMMDLLVWPWMVLMGSAVVDKFKPRGSA